MKFKSNSLKSNWRSPKTRKKVFSILYFYDYNSYIYKEKLLAYYKSQSRFSNPLELIDLDYSKPSEGKIGTLPYTLIFASYAQATFVQDSRVFVNYESKIIYCLNVLCQGKLQNFLFNLEPKKSELLGEIFPPSPYQESGMISGMGVCFGGGKVIHAYGKCEIEGGEQKNCREIYFADLKERKWATPQIVPKDSKQRARHGTTCIYFEWKGTQYLYIIGGFIFDGNKEKPSDCIEQYRVDFSTNTFYHTEINYEKKSDFNFHKCFAAPYNDEILLLNPQDKGDWLCMKLK